MGLAPILTPPTLHRAAVEQLRNAIVTGALAPGVQIKDAELALQLGLSSTPVREALVRLEAEGLVEIEPNRLKRVAPIDLEATVDLLQVQIRLWAIGYEWGASKLGPEDWTRLRTTNNVHRRALDRGEVMTAIVSAHEFHTVLMRASGNRELARISMDRLPLVTRFVLLRTPWVVKAETLSRHHERILDCLEQGNEKAAMDAFSEASGVLVHAAEGLRDAARTSPTRER